MRNQINNNTLNLSISNQITMCTMILTKLSEDINLVINAWYYSSAKVNTENTYN